MPHYVASDLGLHCLPMTFYGFPGKNGLIAVDLRSGSFISSSKISNVPNRKHFWEYKTALTYKVSHGAFTDLLRKKYFPLEPMLTVDNLMKEPDLLSEQNQCQFDQKEYRTLQVKVGKKN